MSLTNPLEERMLDERRVIESFIEYAKRLGISIVAPKWTPDFSETYLAPITAVRRQNLIHDFLSEYEREINQYSAEKFIEVKLLQSRKPEVLKEYRLGKNGKE